MPMVRAEVETYRKDFLRQSCSSAVPSLMVLKKLVSSCSALPALDPAQWRAADTTRSGGMDALLNSTTMEGLDAVPSIGKQFEAEMVHGFPAYNNRFSCTLALALALSSTSRTYSLLWSLAACSERLRRERWQASLAGEWQEQNAPTSPVDHFLKLRFSLLF